MKIKEFVVVLGDYDDFEKRVNTRIEQGYSVYGEVKVDNNMTYPLMISMVKYEEDSRTEVKERKVADVCHLHQMPSIEHIILHRDYLMSKGWTLIEQGHVEAYGWYLKMVKYE